jgi:hypothetical protein
VDDPNVTVPIPKTTHASVEFWIGDPDASEATRRASYSASDWEEVWAGMIWDFDATDTEVVFYGIDYLGLLDYVVDERFNVDKPELLYPTGSMYKNGTAGVSIHDVITAHLTYATGIEDSIVGFIGVGAIDAMNEKVTIPSTFQKALPFITGLIDSHRAGTGKQTRILVQKKVDLTYEFIVLDNPGVNLDGLMLRYGSLVQGYRAIPFGGSWASRVNLIARDRTGTKLTYRSDSSAIDQGQFGRIGQEPTIIETVDNNDLKRRALQAAIDASRLGRQISVGLKLGSYRPLNGYDVCDNVPVEINHGAVTTKEWGSDPFGEEPPTDASGVYANFWTILGISWESYDDGHWMTGLTLYPKGGGRVLPSPDYTCSYGSGLPDIFGPTDAPGGHSGRPTGMVMTVYPTVSGVNCTPYGYAGGAGVPEGGPPFFGVYGVGAGVWGGGTMTAAWHFDMDPIGSPPICSVFANESGGSNSLDVWASDDDVNWTLIATAAETSATAHFTTPYPEHRYWKGVYSYSAAPGLQYYGGFAGWRFHMWAGTNGDPISSSDPIVTPTETSTGWGVPVYGTTTSDYYTDLYTGITYERNDDTETYDAITGTGSVVDFTFTASTQWVINHTIGGYPRVTLRNTSGVVIDAEVVYTSTSVITINLSSAVAGSAHLG